MKMQIFFSLTNFASYTKKIEIYLTKQPFVLLLLAPFGTSQILKLKYQKKWVLEYFTNKRMDPLKSKGRHAISIFIWVQTDISVEEILLMEVWVMGVRSNSSGYELLSRK